MNRVSLGYERHPVFYTSKAGSNALLVFRLGLSTRTTHSSQKSMSRIQGRRHIEPAALNSASGDRQLRYLGTLRFVKRVAMKRVTV